MRRFLSPKTNGTKEYELYGTYDIVLLSFFACCNVVALACGGYSRLTLLVLLPLASIALAS